MSDAYIEFLKAKVAVAANVGLPCELADVNPVLKPHQAAGVVWAVRGGRRALFEAFGLGKSVQQLEIIRIILEKLGGGRGLIVIPLGVRQEFARDAIEVLGWSAPPRFVRTSVECQADGIYLTNYESVREGKIDTRDFAVVSLDEAAILRGLGGSKTFRKCMALLAGDYRETGIQTEGIRFRFVATAVPSPNDYIELLAYSEFLGIMDIGAAKTRWFKRNIEKADALTLRESKAHEFWTWVATWALFVTRPSDIDPTFSDEGYELPPIDVRWHELPTNHSDAGAEKDGQLRMFRNSSIGVQDQAKEKRDSLPSRVAKLIELRADDPGAHRIIWHDLEAERAALESAIPELRTVYGSQELDERESIVAEFAHGAISEIAAKPSMLGSGTNLQRFCAWAIYLGIGFKFHEFVQSLHRLQRFLQTRTVRVDLIYTEAERDVRGALERKWKQHNEMVERMTKIIREYGLAHAAAASQLARSLGVERVEAAGDNYKLVHNDCVLELRDMESNSADLIVTSIPFEAMYEYSDSYHDFGHTDDPTHFWAQMDHLTPQLLRVLRPGRVCAVHVKDRITPGGINGLGFQTISRVSDRCADHFERHGFAVLTRKTIVTDVVRENNQTYRLGWSEQCKDGSRMGAGLPEYLMVFRKPPSDPTNGYADLPVTKDKIEFTRPRWQFDAHGYMRSSGNRLLMPEDLEGLDQAAIFQLFKRHSLEQIYDFRHDVKIAEHVDRSGWLPSKFMLLQPQSWHPDVWADVVRMRTLNTTQANRSKEQHICPLPIDIVERCIEQYSMPGETVLDPFAGLGTVPYCAVRLGRFGIGIELAKWCFLDAASYCAEAAQKLGTPTLFDALEQLEQAA